MKRERESEIKMGNNVGFDVIPVPAGSTQPGAPVTTITERCTYQCRQCGASAPARIATQQYRQHNCRNSARFVAPANAAANCQQHQHNQLQQQLRNSPIFQQFQQVTCSFCSFFQTNQFQTQIFTIILIYMRLIQR